MLGLDEEKRKLRREAEQQRSAAAAAAADAPMKVAARALANGALPANTPVSGYWPIKAELDLRPALEALAARGHPIGLPVIVARGEPLLFRQWSPGDRLIEAGFGTLIPTEDKAEHDPYRVTLRSRAWWRRKFTDAGFAPTRSPYLWRSTRRGVW